MTSGCDLVVYEGKKKDGINGVSHSCVRMLISSLFKYRTYSHRQVDHRRDLLGLLV